MVETKLQEIENEICYDRRIVWSLVAHIKDMDHNTFKHREQRLRNSIGEILQTRRPGVLELTWASSRRKNSAISFPT